MADIYEIHDSLEDARYACSEVREALEDTQDWLDDAAVGYYRGGFDATAEQAKVKQARRDRLVILLEQHEKRKSKLQAEYDAARAASPPAADDMDDE